MSYVEVASPLPKEVTLNPGKTALLILDMNERASNTKESCSRVAPAIANFLTNKIREAHIYVIYTVTASLRGMPIGEVFSGFNRRPDEPVLYPDAYDKFHGCELDKLLKERGITDLIITGSATNVAVLYTATSAARNYRYRVVIPKDGVIANTPYEDNYSLYQLKVLPAGVSDFITISTFAQIKFSEADALYAISGTNNDR